MLCNIQRRKAWERKLPCVPKEADEEQGSSSTSSSSSSSKSRYSSLLDENKQLKRENKALGSEVNSMTEKCNELLHLMAGDGNMEQDKCPKLFGVRLDAPPERKKTKLEKISERINMLLSQ